MQIMYTTPTQGLRFCNYRDLSTNAKKERCNDEIRPAEIPGHGCMLVFLLPQDNYLTVPFLEKRSTRVGGLISSR